MNQHKLSIYRHPSLYITVLKIRKKISTVMLWEKEEGSLSQTKAELAPLCTVKTEAVKSS